jgi:hypothetical protein
MGRPSVPDAPGRRHRGWSCFRERISSCPRPGPVSRYAREDDVGCGTRASTSALGELAVDNNSPFNFFKLTGLTWVDWATLLGFLLTIVGFGVTLWQLHRTQTAIEAVNYERSSINRSTASTRLTKESFPSLDRLYVKARSAADDNNRDRLREILERWSGVGGRR